MKFKIESLIKSSLAPYAGSVHVATKGLAHLAAACVLFCVQTSSWSQTAQINSQIAAKKNIGNESAASGEMQSQIDAINNIVEVSVVIDPPDVDHNRRLYAEEFIKSGCTYKTQNMERIADLVKIIKNSDIKFGFITVHSKSQEPWELREGMWELREGIFLKSVDGVETKFLFDRTRNISTIPGTFNKQPIMASRSLPKHIYQWAAKVRKNAECESSDPTYCRYICEPFFRKNY
jgi:hypothetical protein